MKKWLIEDVGVTVGVARLVAVGVVSAALGAAFAAAPIDGAALVEVAPLGVTVQLASECREFYE